MGVARQKIWGGAHWKLWQWKILLLGWYHVHKSHNGWSNAFILKGYKTPFRRSGHIYYPACCCQMLTKPKKQRSNKPAKFTTLKVLRHIKAQHSHLSIVTQELTANRDHNYVTITGSFNTLYLSNSRMINLAGLFDPCFFTFVSIWQRDLI